jgi:SAM-dependent methyltransferase
MPNVPARDRFLALLSTAITTGSLVKPTLGKPASPPADPTLENLFIRPIALKSGPHLTFVWRHAQRDATKNLLPAEGLNLVTYLLGREFLDAHLFTATHTVQLETKPDGSARVRAKATASATALGPAAHDHAKNYLIPANAPWLRALGVTNDQGQPRTEQAAKFRQIQKFAELIQTSVAETFPNAETPIHVADMGSGKGYLTFAVATLLGAGATVTGREVRPELVDLCNRVARENFLPNLTFSSGVIPAPKIADPESKIENPIDVLIALHACDTATDDALAHGIVAGARLLIVSPCCQKEVRPQLVPPPVLADALRHGIFQERQAEFVTDALRALLLEWAGYKTKVFEFISTEHTAKNLLIVAQRVRVAATPDDPAAQRLRDFARFYGVRHQRLATHFGFAL